MADSPMERAVRALGGYQSSEGWVEVVAPGEVRTIVHKIATLRTSDPDAFAAVLAECGVPLYDDLDHHLIEEYRKGDLSLCAEGQAVIEGRVVDLLNVDTIYIDNEGFINLYRVKPERSDRPRTTRPCDCEDAWCPHTHSNDAERTERTEDAT